MLLKRCHFTLSNEVDNYQVIWQLARITWLVTVEHRQSGGWKPIGENIRISVFTLPVPTPERSIELIGTAISFEKTK